MRRCTPALWAIMILPLALAAPGALALEAKAKTPTAILTGIIETADDGKPIAGARVELYAARDPGVAMADRLAGRPMPSRVGEATTDTEGLFRVEAPPGALIWVVANAKGRQTSGAMRPVPVGPAGSTRWLGSIALPAGRVVSGKVLDAVGKPAAKARIHVTEETGGRRQRGGGSFARAMQSAGITPYFQTLVETSNDGSFRVEGLPDRAVQMRVYAEGLAPALIVSDPAKAGAASPLTIRLERGVTIEGKVVAPDGKTPMPSAWVLAGEGGVDGITRSGKDGGFSLAHVRSRTISITATVARSFAPNTEDFPPEAFWAPSPSASAKAAAAPLTLRLRPGAVVKARALDRETREPLSPAILTLAAGGGEQTWMAAADAQGTLVVGGLIAGAYGVSGMASGYLEENLPNLPLPAGRPAGVSLALRPASSLEGTVRDVAGRPVGKATVSMLGPPPGLRALPMAIFVPLSIPPALTDAQGHFRIENLPSRAELQVRVEADGFAAREVKGISLRPGEHRDGLEVLLENGITITGRLLDVAGNPVAGGSVSPARRGDTSPGGGMVIRMAGAPQAGRRRGAGGGNPMANFGDEPLDDVITGPDGVFRSRGARPGIWSLRVKAAGHAPKNVSGLKLEEGARTLDAGDIRLEPSVTIRGRVQTSSGAPVPLARGTVRKDFATLSDFVTQPDGYFTAGDLVPGEPVTLSLDADGYASSEKGGLTPPVEDLIITLAPASKVMGKVQDVESRQPIADFSVGVSRARAGGGGGGMMAFRMAGPQSPFHDEDGLFTVEEIDPGKVSVTASASGYKDATLADLEVPEGANLEGLVFTLDRAVMVSGVVIDDRGRPLAGAAVEKKEGGQGFGGVRFNAGGAGTAVTDGDGRFAVMGLDRGTVTLSFTHPDFEPHDEEINAARDVEGIKVSLSRGGTITGMVLREEDGSAVAGASVMAQGAGGGFFSGGRSVTSGQDGAFTFEGIPSGRYTIRAEATGLRTGSAEGVVVAQGATPAPVEIRLAGGVTLTGSILNVKEEEMPQFTVRGVAGGLGGFGATAPVDASGHFEMHGLAPGPLTLIAQSGLLGGRSASRSIEIPHSATTWETTIEFPKGSTIEGIVTRGGLPVGGASVLFIMDASRATASATTDTEGRYTVDNLDAGDYKVMVMNLTAGLNHSTDTTVGADRRFDIEIPMARIAGYVTDAATGQPLEGATLDIAREGPQAPTAGFLRFNTDARTDASGYFSFENLEEGTWNITARSSGYGYEVQPVAIVSGARPEDITFALSRSQGYVFRALDAVSGQSLRSLSVLALTGGGGDPLSAAGDGARVVHQGQVEPDAAGLFKLDSLQPGIYRLVLGGQNIATMTLPAVTVPGREATYTFTTGGTLQVSVPGLSGSETAKMVLLDSQRQPVHVNSFFPQPLLTLRAGSPSVYRELPAGTWRLRASLPGGVVVEHSVTLTDGATTQISLP